MVETLTQIQVAGRAKPSHEIKQGEIPANKSHRVLSTGADENVRAEARDGASQRPAKFAGKEEQP
jgi:hypothetical protein